MRICVFGAGAIGGLMAAKLAAAGEDVSLVARGAKLDAIRTRGLTLISEGATTVTHPRVSADPRDLGAQDVLILATKANALSAIADTVQPLLGPQTTIVPAINGIPWWYFFKLEGPYENNRLESVDPGGVLWDRLPPSQVVGCVVYPAADVIEPGVVDHTYGNRFDIGEPDGSKSARATAFAQAMIKAGFRCPIRPRLRDSLWVKLWGSLSFNIVCALTMAPFDVVAADTGTRAVVRQMMVEAQTVAERVGVKFPLDVDARIAGAEEVGSHKPSTLVDLERKLPMEIEALLGAVVEMARLTDTPTPTCDTVLALIRLRARMM